MSSQGETGKAPGIAVIGCGRISRSHLAAVAGQACGTLVVTVDSDLSLAREAASRYGATFATNDYAAALAHPDVDAVVLCLPNHLHASAALRAIEAGKHVLVEKPMAGNAHDARAMARAAAARGVVLAVAQCRRHFRAIRYLAEHQADFGEVISAQVSLGVFWPDAQAPWWREADKASGLVIALNGPHVLDFVQMVMRCDPLRVHAEAMRRKQYWAGEDEAMILLAYPGGRLASVHLSFNQQPVENRKVLVCERGTVVIENDTRLDFNGETLVMQGDDERRHYLDEAVEFERQFHEFTLAIAGQPNRSVSAEEGVRLMHTLDAVSEAFQRCETVVPRNVAQRVESVDAVP